MAAALLLPPDSASVRPSIVYLDGNFIPSTEARVHVDDRAFLFGDGVYEVTKLARTPTGVFIFTEKEHFARLRRGLSELRIDAHEAVAALPGILRELVVRNNIEGQCYCYIQITRGAAAPRSHAWAGTHVKPTVYANVKPYTFPTAAAFALGATATLEADQRWARCDLKTTSLLPNVLANQRAKEVGAYEALFTRVVDGESCVVEASHSNVFAVMLRADGARELVTPPLANILPGVTRGVTLARGAADAALLAAADVVAMREGAIPVAGLADGRVVELMVTASTSFIVAITSVVVGVEGNPLAGSFVGPVGDGRVGRAATALREAWAGWWHADIAEAR